MSEGNINVCLLWRKEGQEEKQELRIKLDAMDTFNEVAQKFESLFGRIKRLQGRRGEGGDWTDVNDRDTWIRFMRFWMSPKNATVCMYLDLETEEDHQLLGRKATASDLLFLRAINKDQGKRYEKPFPWIQGQRRGVGARGIVFDGETEDKKPIAAKFVEIVNDDVQEIYDTEIELLGKMDHHNVIKMLGYHQENLRNGYILLELAQGDLRDILGKSDKGGEALAPALTQNYMRQIMSAISYIHSLNIMHRDVKSENFLVIKSDLSDPGTLKLSDFGVSMEVDPDCRDSASGEITGSMYWHAPEMCQLERYGLKVDVWSAGCVLIEMLTGDFAWPPFTSTIAAITFIGNATGFPPNLPRDLPEPLNDFAHRCLQRDPALRATAEELMQHPYLQPNK